MTLRLLKAIFGTILAVLALLPQGPAVAAATLLPPGEQCFAALSPTSGGPNGTGTGMVGLLGPITGGSGGTTGVYGGVALTGGSGSGATANITVSGGAVTAVAVLNPGVAYVAGDSLSALSANIGGASGFSVSVSSVSINSSLAGGTVTMYVPNTTTFKQTWFNSDQASIHQNTNPINLDANGCAIIYGVGSYRQILKDSLGNTIWDQITTDTSASNSVFWAGLAAGTPNAITVIDTGFNGTDGSIIQFIPLSSNTGPATLNPSGFGNISIVKDTSTGAVALTGGEIVANSPSNVVSVSYSASQSNFHILNLINSINPTTPQTLCGAIGLKIINDSGTPNTKIDLTADQITMITAGGQTISRTNVSLVLNLTVNGANGLDTGPVAPSTWYYIWVVDNGSGAASLASISATAPTLPSGYSYRCRLGAMRADGSGNLLRTLQLGSAAQYTAPPIMVTGVFGAAWTGVSVAGFVPTTATRISSVMEVSLTSASGTSLTVAVAPNGSYGALPTASPYAPCLFSLGTASASGTTTDQNQICDLVLESSQIFTGQTGAATINSLNLSALGWTDKVNAN